MSKENSKATEKKEKRGLFWKILIAVFLVLIILAGAIFAIVWHKLDLIQYEDEIPDATQTRTADGNDDPDAEPDEKHDEDQDEGVVDVSGLEMVTEPPEIPDMEIFGDSDVLNIMVIGTDERADDFSTNARSDCMIILSINKEDKTVKMISLERGMGVPILEGQYEGQYDWLTHVFRYGGADLLKKTVEYCFKVEVPYYVRFNFHSVEDVVNAVGGVDIELTALEADGLNGKIRSNAITRHEVHEGLNHLDGYDALQFARQRYIDSDWRRVERQRKVILAVVEAVKGAGLLEFNELADTVLPMIQTNMEKSQVADLIFYAPTFLKSDFDQMTIPKKGTYGGMAAMEGRTAYAPDYEINNDLIRRFLYEGATSEELLAE